MFRTRAHGKIAESDRSGQQNPSFPRPDPRKCWITSHSRTVGTPQAWQYLPARPGRRIVTATSAANCSARLQGIRMNGPASADRKTPDEVSRTERLSVAALRRARPIRLWGGKGCGVPCDFCRVLVSSTEVEYEVEAELDGAPMTLHFHPRCHDAWKLEIEAHGADTESAGSQIQTPAA